MKMMDAMWYIALKQTRPSPGHVLRMDSVLRHGFMNMVAVPALYMLAMSTSAIQKTRDCIYRNLRKTYLGQSAPKMNVDMQMECLPLRYMYNVVSFFFFTSLVAI